MLLEKITVTAISHLRVTASWDGTSAGSDSEQAVYNPPPGYVVLNTRTKVHSSSNGGGAVSVLAGGLKLVTEEDIEEVYDEAIDFAASKNNASLKAKLVQKKKKHLREFRRYETNKNSIVAKVKAKAHGSVLDRKRGWHEISVEAELLNIGKPGSSRKKSKRILAGQIEQEFNIDIPGI